jgi:hypothetical protein
MELALLFVTLFGLVSSSEVTGFVMKYCKSEKESILGPELQNYSF